MHGGGGPCHFGLRRHSTRAGPIFALGDLSIALHDQPRVFEFPMGHPAAGDRLSRDLLRAGWLSWLADQDDGFVARTETVAHCPFSVPLAAVPADVRIGLCETSQPRRDLE